MLVTCVPMPPLFFDWPLRLMIEPFEGRRPVIAQILAMMISSWLKGRSKGPDRVEARGILPCSTQESSNSVPPDRSVTFCMQHLKFLAQIRRMQELHQG